MIVTEYRIEDLPERIAARITINPASGCWISSYRDNGRGYTSTSWNGKPFYTHRLVYTLLVGPIPGDLPLDHVKARGCTSTRCCNPAHLEPVTYRENNLRSDCITSLNARKTYCKRGHPFDEENTYITRNGGRACRQCQHDGSRVIRERKAAREGRTLGIARAERDCCAQGHEYTPENTIIDSRGARSCRTCRRQRNLRWRERKLQAAQQDNDRPDLSV